MFGFKKGKDQLVNEEEVKELIKNDKNIKLIDVRTPMEYRPEHLTPCTNVDVRDKSFKDKIRYFDKEHHYILYCANGRRSSKAKRIMQSMGFDDVKVLEGGLNKWLGSLRLK